MVAAGKSRWREIKKASAGGDRGLTLKQWQGRSVSAGSGAAGSGAATATSYRITGGDGETGAIACLEKVDLNGAGGGEQSFFHQKSNPVFFKSFIIFFWLIQSQSQRRACSATLHQSDADCWINIILREICFQVLDSWTCYFKHNNLLDSLFKI